MCNPRININRIEIKEPMFALACKSGLLIWYVAAKETDIACKLVNKFLCTALMPMFIPAAARLTGKGEDLEYLHHFVDWKSHFPKVNLEVAKLAF